MRARVARVLVVTTGALACLLLVPWAWGMWTTGGAGSGAAATASSLTVVLTAGTPSTQVYPGGSADVALTVTNPNLFDVLLGTLDVDTSQGTAGFAVDASHTGCGLGVLTFTSQSNGGSGWTVPARSGGVDGTLAVTLTGALAMSTAAADACQGASFTVYLRASG